MPASPTSSSSSGNGKGRAPAPPQPILLEGAPIQAWSVYSHPDRRYRGVWLQSKQAEYHLGAPSPEYAPLAEAFAECVRHAVAVHLFVTDVLGVEDAEGQHIGLDMLLEVMAGMAGDGGGGRAEGGADAATTERPLDRAFAERHAGPLYDLLRGLNLGSSLDFMADLVRGVCGCGCVGVRTGSIDDSF